MNKPFSLTIAETEQQIVNILNNAQLPAYCLKNMLEKIYNQIEKLDQEEIEKYNESIKNKSTKK